jgi:hypothetical protein
VAVPNAEVFIAGANFEDSAIFKLWGEDGIEFEPDPEPATSNVKWSKPLFASSLRSSYRMAAS